MVHAPLLDEFCNNAVGRDEGEGLSFSVLVCVHSAELPLAIVVAVAMSRVEVPRRDFEVGGIDGYLLARHGRYTQDARRLVCMFWIDRKAKHAVVTVSKALAEGVRAGAGRGMRLEFPLELRTEESVATAIEDRTAVGAELPRRPLLGAEDTVSSIVERDGQGACAATAWQGSQPNQLQGGCGGSPASFEP